MVKRKKEVRFGVVGLTALACTLAVAGCDEDLIDDATFRLWCGETLCAWTLEQGHVRRAPTWHKNDFGVELVDTPTTISQELKNNNAKCLTFTTIADVDPNAQVSVGLDFNGDGKIDYDQPIAAVGFREVKTQVTSPRSSGKLPRIFITKRGTGRAVLAQIRLQGSSSCNAPPFRMKDRPLGEPCDQAADSTQQSECKSGVCCEGICAECCVAPRALDFVADGGGTAVAKPPEMKCPDNQVCERRDVPHLVFLTESVPLQCNPGRRDRLGGTTCLADDDCQSGECVGATSTAFDKEKAFNSLADAEARRCPSDFPDAGPRENCEFINVTEGQCR